MVYGGNNKAYGIGTAATDDPQILELLQKFATVGLTDEEFSLLVNLVLNGEAMKVLEVDLITRQVTEVAGIPITAGFGYPFMYKYGDKVYAEVTNSGENAFYEINTATSTGTRLFNLTTGGFAYQMIDISVNR